MVTSAVSSRRRSTPRAAKVWPCEELYCTVLFAVTTVSSPQSVRRHLTYHSRRPISPVATELDPNCEYTVVVTKRTEPQMRGALSTFKVHPLALAASRVEKLMWSLLSGQVCTFYGFIVESAAEVLPCRPKAARRIEFIGDSVTSAVGNEGKATSSKSRFGIKGRTENVHNGYACILARMFDAEAHVLAWTGKGVHSNAGDWGPNLPMLWKNTIASREGEGEWGLSTWTPDVVVVNVGANDLFPPASLETEIVSAYALFLAEIRQRTCLCLPVRVAGRSAGSVIQTLADLRSCRVLYHVFRSATCAHLLCRVRRELHECGGLGDEPQSRGAAAPGNRQGRHVESRETRHAAALRIRQGTSLCSGLGTNDSVWECSRTLLYCVCNFTRWTGDWTRATTRRCGTLP